MNTKPQLLTKPIRQDYATLPITQAFDWDIIFEDAIQAHRLPESAQLYLVVFRSQLLPDADTDLLREHDERAHEAANKSPALLHYFGGVPDQAGRALSFCLWTDATEARIISKDASHRAATKMTRMYDSYTLERYYVYRSRDGLKFEAR